MARGTGINVTLRWAEGGFVSGYVSTTLCEAYIELTEEQARKLHLELCKRFGWIGGIDFGDGHSKSVDVPVFVPTGGGSDK